jgi:glycosyltransferase involved in cell wall biosynthesis
LAKAGYRFELVLVGDGELRPSIEQALKCRGLESSVRITGWRDGCGVIEEILQSRATVLPSFAEGLPVVLMESLALGRPAISTYVSGIPELIEPGTTGWLVPAGSAAALAEAMRTVLDAPVEQLAAMGREGARRVAEQHNAAKEARKLAELFAASIRSRQAAPGSVADSHPGDQLGSARAAKELC